MVDDVITSSSLSIMLIQYEELEEAPIDVNVFQQSHEKEPIKKVVCTWVVQSMWDCHVLPNPHALAIYLKLVHA